MSIFKEKKEEVKPVCEHEECAECHHLITKGSGQKVVHENIRYYGGSRRTVTYCDLHKKPYDLVTQNYTGTIYEKKNEPYRRVNEDGTDYVEPKKQK